MTHAVTKHVQMGYPCQQQGWTVQRYDAGNGNNKSAASQAYCQDVGDAAGFEDIMSRVHAVTLQLQTWYLSQQ